jgi:hypothetical protein
LYGEVVPPGTEENKMTTPSSEGLLATSQGNVAYPKRPAADPELKLQ